MSDKKLFSFLVVIIITATLTLGLSKLITISFPNIALSKQELSGILITIFILVSFLYNAFREGRFYKIIFQLLAWQLIVLLAIIIYVFKADFNDAIMRVTSAIIPSYGVNYKPGEIIVSRSIDGHFYIQVAVNDKPVKFMIDTGASDVSLTREDAARLGFDITNLQYTKIYSTANGLSSAAPVRLNKFAVGNKIFTNIQAHVASGQSDISLLGMSVISLFKSFRIDNNLLILSY